MSSEFLGADFTSESSTVSEDKSPNVINMIRSVPGKIRKRMGYHPVMDYEDHIYGAHKFTVTGDFLVHAGTKLYNFARMASREWVDDDDKNVIAIERKWGRDRRSVTNTTVYDIDEWYMLKEPLAGMIDHDEYESVAPVDVYDPANYDTPIVIEIVKDDGNGGDEVITDPLHFPYDGLEEIEGLKSVTFDFGSKTIKFTTFGKYPEVYIPYVSKEQIKAHNILFLTGDIEDNCVYDGMAEHRSVSFQLGQKLVILDGTSVKIYDGNGIHELSEVAYVPTLTISKNPDGGGTDYEPLNLICPTFIEQFVVDSTSEKTKKFQMTFGDLDDDKEVKAWLLDKEGNWVEKYEGTDFTVDRKVGLITFTTAPGLSPVTGEDNVKIQVSRTVEGYADRINHCTIGILFGVNGANDRLFVSGNTDSGRGVYGDLYSYINYDWFSQQYDPTYFGDTWYAKLGSDAAAIMGYSIINNYLAAHKDYNEDYQSVLIREGNLVDGQPSFKLINTLQGTGAISRYAFSYLATEPVFLTPLGIYAITAQDVTGEKYAQNRSYYLEGRLLKEEGLENAHSVAWKDYYILAINDHLYILDGLQPIRTDRSRPYATRQYAGFYFENVPATTMFVIDNELFFGTATGKIMKWYTDEKDISSYNDDGEAIEAIWETCDISEKHFYKNKTYRYIAVRCPPEITSSVEIWAQKNGIWEVIKEDNVTLNYISFQKITFSKFTFSTNKTQRVTASKMRLKKLDHARFRFVNRKLNEPLGINDYAVEFTQAGNRK